MKHFLKFTLWPVVAGLLTSFVIMMVCEFINSYFYPLPPGLDTGSMQAVRDFTQSLPWTAYVLVLLGWILGSFAAGFVTTKLSGERAFRLSLIVGVILTLLGILNNIMIGHDMFFNIVGLPMFLIFTYLGHRFFLKSQSVTVQQ